MGRHGDSAVRCPVSHQFCQPTRTCEAKEVRPFTLSRTTEGNPTQSEAFHDGTFHPVQFCRSSHRFSFHQFCSHSFEPHEEPWDSVSHPQVLVAVNGGHVRAHRQTFSQGRNPFSPLCHTTQPSMEGHCLHDCAQWSTHASPSEPSARSGLPRLPCINIGSIWPGYDAARPSSGEQSCPPLSIHSSKEDNVSSRFLPGIWATPGHNNAQENLRRSGTANDIVATYDFHGQFVCPISRQGQAARYTDKSNQFHWGSFVNRSGFMGKVNHPMCGEVQALCIDPSKNSHPAQSVADYPPGIWATPGHSNAQNSFKVARGADDTDVISLMAAGARIRSGRPSEVQSTPIMDNPAIAAQEWMPDDPIPETSDDESSSSEENPPWRDFYVYTVHQPPVQVSLNMVAPRLQIRQCARALGWTTAQLIARYQVDPCPQDLRNVHMRGMLARFHTDPAEHGPLVMVLVDVEFHPPAPSWDAEIIRTAMFVPRSLTNHQFLASMHLMPYCKYVSLPCMLIIHDQRINLDQEVEIHPRDGVYIRVILPPPNLGEDNIPTRCAAMACYQGIDPEHFEVFNLMVEEYNLWAMPNPYQILVVDSPDQAGDETEETHFLQVGHPRPQSPSNTEVNDWKATEVCTRGPHGPVERPAVAQGAHNRKPCRLSCHLHALVSNTSDPPTLQQGAARSKERSNSQRTGRQNPEEKKSGMTHTQPASRAQRPDKQPADGSREPLPKLPVSMSISVMSESVGPKVMQANASSTNISAQDPQALDKHKAVTSPKPAGPKGNTSLSPLRDPATGDSQALPTKVLAAKSVSGPVPSSAVSILRVCFLVSEALIPNFDMSEVVMPASVGPDVMVVRVQSFNTDAHVRHRSRQPSGTLSPGGVAGVGVTIPLPFWGHAVGDTQAFANKGPAVEAMCHARSRLVWVSGFPISSLKPEGEPHNLQLNLLASVLNMQVWIPGRTHMVEPPKSFSTQCMQHRSENDASTPADLGWSRELYIRPPECLATCPPRGVPGCPGIQATPGYSNAWECRYDLTVIAAMTQLTFFLGAQAGSELQHVQPSMDSMRTLAVTECSWLGTNRFWPPNGHVQGPFSNGCWSPARVATPAHNMVTPFQEWPRVGEASKPGPASDKMAWVIGAVNPTGLAGKAQQFRDMPSGIYAVSETHLSERSQARFREELHYSKVDLKLYPGYRAPLKKDSLHSVGGKHTGVAFLTSFPTRPIVSGWDPELYATSRIHAASFLVNNTWVTGGVCYGYAKDSDSGVVQDNTNRLLQELSKQVFHGFKGPAFIAGDFNQVPGVLSEVSKWEQRGWKDVQTWAAEQFGVSPGVTCQYTTRKDYIYLSPELQCMMQRCTNSFDRWPDHSSLLGYFSHPQPCPPIPRWDKPANIDYSELTPQEIASQDCLPAPCHADPTTQYAAICEQFENHVHHCLKAKGKHGLQPHQRGRGQTLQRTFRRQVVAPIKPARQGECQPTVHTWSLLHSRWITQCRRLQSYAKHVFKGSTTSTAIEHRAALWHAIRKGLGFVGGFEAWWKDQATEQPHMIPWLPQAPPDAEVAQHISQQFHQILMNMERQIINQRVQQAKRRRIEDTNRIFRDVRKPAPVPVSMLVAKAATQVTEVVDEGSVEVLDSGPIQEATVLETHSGPLHVLHIEENQVWFTSPHSLLPGDELAIVDLQGQVGEVHDAFLREWTQRWDRHRHLSQDHWDEVIALTQSMLHADTMKLEPLTLERWKHAIRSKKATAATGLDAVARRDLLAFPDSLHQQLLDIFRVAEETGQWPAQLLQGAVHSLEKVAGAQHVSQYRPITVMPCAYRIYTSIRSREVLQHLAKVTPPTLLGNIPGKQAVSLWWTMQHRIEQSMYAGEPMTGAVSDLCKAFNHLPRTVTFQIAASMGIHPNILRAWAASTIHLKQHFVVRDSPSAQVTSTTGFVEGCGMSVVGMVLVNILVHAYMQHQHPEALFTTYVDNYEIQTASVEQTTKALRSLQRFCELLDVQLDTQKTYRWACDATGRADLRAMQVTPIKAAKDLGAHIQYTANLTNGTVLAKFRKLPDLWHKLSRSHSPQVQKLKVLRVVAWPRVLYSGAIVHIGKAHFDEARAGAFRALGLQKSGANAQVFLSLMAPAQSDPEFYALWHSVTQFRRHIPEELVDLTLYHAAITPARKRKPGPGGVLITRLESVCWTYVSDGRFNDGEGGTIHILTTPHQELKARLSRAWQHAVGRRWEHRKGFAGLRYVSASLSQIDTTKYSLDDIGFLQVVQTGAFYTADCLQHSRYTDDPRCARCQEQDSVEHRHWQCPATAQSRMAIPVAVQQFIDQQPPCTREHGWIQEPLEVRQFKETLTQIQDTSMVYLPHAKQQHYDLFCDGAGQDPTQPLSRVVAWGVVIAGPDLQSPHRPLAWGGVPGFWQTVIRAELTAFLSAVQYGVMQGTTFSVWSDCLVIIRRARRIQQGEFQVTSNCTDHDLWTAVQQILPQEPICTLHHIKSHQTYHDDEPWIQWACSANDMADLVAATALSMLPPDVLQAQQKASQAVKQAKEVCFHVHAHMVRVARMSVSQVQPTMSPVARLPDTEVLNWGLIATAASNQAPDQLRFPKWLKILEWMQWISNPGTPPRWISWFELMTSFQLYSGEWGVESTSRHNTWQMHRKLVEYDCKQMLRSWSSYLLHLIRLQYPGFKPVDGRPSNPRFACWAMGVSCEMAQVADQQIGQWMEVVYKERKITKMTDLYLAEPATMDCPVPDAVGPTTGLHRYWRGQR